MSDKNMLARLAKIDEQLFLSVFSDASPRWLQATARGFSKSGDGGLYILFATCLWWFSEQQHHQLLILSMLIGFALERPIYFVTKKRFARTRPCDCIISRALLVPSDKFSLPSGHSAGAFVVATVLCHFYPELSLLWLTWASGVAISRVVVGVHYPADVVIGAAMGASCAMVAVIFVESL